MHMWVHKLEPEIINIITGTSNKNFGNKKKISSSLILSEYTNNLYIMPLKQNIRI